jgi:4-hydroxy-2-oxoheptanedioate aldolase
MSSSVMKSANRLRSALSTGNGLSIGAWQMLPGTHLSRLISRVGFDWVCIDCEHGNIAGKVSKTRLQSSMR